MITHIEFYGLPGCGKSTVSELVTQELEKSGYTVIRAGADTGDNMNPFMRKILKFERTIRFFVFHPGKWKQVKEIVSRNGYSRQSDRLRQIINIAQKLYYYTAKESNQIIIWDEGLTQAAVSLSINCDIPGSENETVLKKISGVDSKQINIYIKESTETVLMRMEKRRTNNSRVEQEKTQSGKIALLQKYNTVCDSIIPHIEIMGNNRPAKEIAEEILEKLLLQ